MIYTSYTCQFQANISSLVWFYKTITLRKNVWDIWCLATFGLCAQLQCTQQSAHWRTCLFIYCSFPTWPDINYVLEPWFAVASSFFSFLLYLSSFPPESSYFWECSYRCVYYVVSLLRLRPAHITSNEIKRSFIMVKVKMGDRLSSHRLCSLIKGAIKLTLSHFFLCGVLDPEGK